MSNKNLNWAWRLQLKPGPKLVLICLADMADDSGCCFPKQSTVALRTGLDRSTVNKHLKVLKRLGHVKQYQQRYADGRIRSSRYQLMINEPFLPCADLPQGKTQHDLVVISHNRIPQRDPLYIQGGFH